MPGELSANAHLKGRVSRSVGWVVLEKWGTKLLSLLVFALLARLIEPDSFGVVAMAMSVIAVLQVLVESGFTKALIQVKVLEKPDASTAFWTSVAFGLAGCGLLFLLAPALADALGDEALIPILQVLGITLPIWAFSQTPAALLERSLDFRPLSIRQLVASIIASAVAVTLAILNFGVWALVAQAVVSAVVSCIVLWASTSWRPSWSFSLRSLRRLSRTGLGVMATQLLDALQGNIDKIAVGALFNAEVLGYYFIAQRLIIILTELVTSVIARVSFPTFSLVQSDGERLRRIFGKMTFVSGMIGIPAFGFLAAFAPQVMPAVFGQGWEPSIPLLWALAGAGAFTTVIYFDRPALLATGHTAPMVWLAVAQNLLGIVLLFALLPLGVYGVVISQWARVFIWPMRLWILRRTIGLGAKRYIAQVVRVLVAFLPVCAGVFLLQLTPWSTAPIPLLSFVAPVALLALVVYACTTWLTAGPENRELLRQGTGGMARKLASLGRRVSGKAHADRRRTGDRDH